MLLQKRDKLCTKHGNTAIMQSPKLCDNYANRKIPRSLNIPFPTVLKLPPMKQPDVCINCPPLLVCCM